MTTIARTYGPVRAAGTRVEELDADRTIESGSLGVTAYLGILEKGPTDDLISTYGKKDMARKVGGRISASLVPDAAQHFWDHSEGAGELHFIRVTDGTGVQAQRTLYTRRLTANSLGYKRQALATVKAHNVGRWGGKRKVRGGIAAGGIGDFTTTTLTTGVVMLLNEWKDAELTLDGVIGKTYKVLSNTIAGVITIESDQDMITDLGGAPVDFGWTVKHANAGKACAIEVGIDDIDPTNRFYLKTYIDGNPIKTYEHLSIDPTDEYYYEKVVNDDVTAFGNFEVRLTNLWSGGVAADVKPGWNGVVTSLSSDGKTLTVDPYFFNITSPTGANPTFALGATTSIMEWEDTLTITVLAGAATGSVTSAHWGALSIITFGAAYTPTTPYLPPFTITNGATPLAVGDVITVEWTPFVPNGLKNAILIPRLAAPSYRYNVQSNTINTITVNATMSPAAPIAGSQWMLIHPIELEGGYDGADGVADADYVAALDTVASYFNKLRGKNKGLVKMASPGKTTTAVQQAGLAYAEYNAYQWRIEIPLATTTEDGAITQINDTIGRSDLGTGVTIFPSFERVSDPDRPSILKNVPSVGMIHGREAKIAVQFGGYHRAGAGTIASLPLVKAHPTNVPEELLNEERLNPAGISVSKKIDASFYVWGDRTVSRNSAWTWKHQREQMCHYINTLRESFPWALFDINDPISDMPILAALVDFFKNEWDKRALDRSFAFEDACQIKMDGSVNTSSTRAAGDKIAEVKLRLANVTERLVIRIGKAGIFEAVEA